MGSRCGGFFSRYRANRSQMHHVWLKESGGFPIIRRGLSNGLDFDDCLVGWPHDPVQMSLDQSGRELSTDA